MNRFKRAGVFIVGALLTFTLSSSSAFAADYTVLPNDSLYKISILFNESLSSIKSNNNLKSNLIYPGQVLDVAASTYTVKNGDTLFLIAKKQGITLSLLRQANNKWNDMLYPGQKLLLPAVNTIAKTTLVSTNSEPVISYTQNELDLLARLITAEATGEPYEAMLGVGAVVVNRVVSPVWPSTITTVINHVAGGYYQFTPVKNGYIKNPASATALKAANAVLKGSDPTNGAMFYFDNSSTNEWLRSKKVAFKSGTMIFAY